MTPSQPALQVHFPVTWWQVEWCRQSQPLLHPGPYQPSAHPATSKGIAISSQISFIFKSQRQNLERTLTLELKNSWTPKIFLEYLCVAGNKPIRREKTEPQEASYFVVLRSTCVCWSCFGHYTINIPKMFLKYSRFSKFDINLSFKISAVLLIYVSF